MDNTFNEQLQDRLDLLSVEIEELDLANSDLCNLAVDWSRFSNLKLLNLSNNNLTTLNGLENIKTLTSIVATNNKIVDVSNLAKLTDLRFLDLSSNDQLDINSIPLVNTSLSSINIKLNQDLITNLGKMESDDVSSEPILKPNKNRFTLFPLKYHQTWDFYKRAQASHWTAEEIKLDSDIDHWNNKLSDNERKFVKRVLAFFAASDGIVSENLASKFYDEVQIPEARAAYAFQIYIETVHSEVYSLLIDSYISDPTEKDLLFNAIEYIPSIKMKAEWAIKWMGSNRSFGERLIAFAAVEGIFFSASFCSIFWLKKKGLLPGLTFSNELISRDENLHCDFAVHLFSMLETKPSNDIVLEIIKSAVAVEKEFVRDSLSVDLIGMNSNLMCQYVEFIADRLLNQLIKTSFYNVTQPFEWLNLGMQAYTNFFEKQVSDYARPTGSKRIFDLSRINDL